MNPQRLLIDSRDRTSQSTLDNCTFVLDKPIVATEKCSVDFVLLFNTMFNVTSQNNGFVLDGITRTVPRGYYTSSSIVVAMDTLLKSIDVATGVVYNSTTGIASWTLGSHILTPSAMSAVLGTTVTSYTGNFHSFINTSYPQIVQFYSPELSTDSQRTTNRTSLDATPFLIVPLFASYNSLNYYQPNFPLVLNCATSAITRISIYLRDSLGNPLENISDYQLSLTFF